MLSQMSNGSDKAQSLFGLGAGMAAPVFGMASNIITQSMTDKYNREMALRAEQRQRDAEREAYSRAMHQQRIADAYNTPSAIMSRLREAGLNPLIAFNNGMSGNLSTGVPNAVTPQTMGQSTSTPVDTEMFSAFMQMNDQILKQRELEIMANKYEFDNAKTDAERQGILKTNSYMDAVENDRHAEANSRILNNAAQRELFFAQRFKAIDDCINAANQLFENRRQFNVKMKYLKDKDAYDNKAREYEREVNWLMQEKEMALRERMEDATNQTWMNATLANNEYSKFSHFLSTDDSPWKHVAQYEGVKAGSRFVGDLTSNIAGSVSLGGLVRRTRNLKERIGRFQQRYKDNKAKKEQLDKANLYQSKADEAFKKGDYEACEHWNNEADAIFNELFKTR